MMHSPTRQVHMRGQSAWAVCWRQWRAERSLARRGIHFRSTNLDQLAQAYAAMTADEFDAINGRQDWANWRTIPRALTLGQLPAEALDVLDLGCGTGSSTQVLAWHCPPGSRILGYELAAPLIPIAQRRSYLHAGGDDATVHFRCQGVTEAFRQADDAPWPDRSIDLVNASGVVGHHLNEHSVGPLIAELTRVLKADGLATLDVGPTLSADTLAKLMGHAGFRCLGHCRSWLLDPTGQLVFRRNAAEIVR